MATGTADVAGRSRALIDTNVTTAVNSDRIVDSRNCGTLDTRLRDAQRDL
jgi:hypothetical protein